MPNIIIYHNPRCSKSRETLKLLQDKQIEPQIIEYLTTPPSVDELTNIVKQLKLAPRDLLRKTEEEFKTLGLSDKSLSDEALILAMTKHPRLIQRPIVINGNKAALGRPPENVLEILF